MAAMWHLIEATLHLIRSTRLLWLIWKKASIIAVLQSNGRCVIALWGQEKVNKEKEIEAILGKSQRHCICTCPFLLLLIINTKLLIWCVSQQEINDIKIL